MQPILRENTIKVECAEKLLPIITTPKRLKLMVGSRGGSKSILGADCWLKYCDQGERLCAAREFQNTLEESVHALLTSRIEALQGPDPLDRTLYARSNKVISDAGGEIFYRGLARNPKGIKSMFGVNKMLIEEAETLSETSIRLLMPTIREGDSEIWMIMNRGSSRDPIAVNFLKPYERELSRNGGFFEDEDIMIVDINYYENPFFPEVLDQERKRDKKNLPRATYRHIWHGEYSDSVANAIITPDMFDACIDAHLKLGIEAAGIEVLAHDPSDRGKDAKTLAYRHGIVIEDVQYKYDGDINEGGDWASSYAIARRVDEFIWDGDGMGTGLRRQFDTAFFGKKITATMFKGSEEADFPDQIYEPMDSEIGSKARPNKETFTNKRAQYYWDLRDRMLKTFHAVVNKKYHDPEELISFSSKIRDIDILRSEICQIPRKENASGRFQVLSKPEMKKPPYNLESPGGSDVVMMSLACTGAVRKKQVQKFRVIENIQRY